MVLVCQCDLMLVPDPSCSVELCLRLAPHAGCCICLHVVGRVCSGCHSHCSTLNCCCCCCCLTHHHQHHQHQSHCPAVHCLTLMPLHVPADDVLLSASSGPAAATHSPAGKTTVRTDSGLDVDFYVVTVQGSAFGLAGSQVSVAALPIFSTMPARFWHPISLHAHPCASPLTKGRCSSECPTSGLCCCSHCRLLFSCQLLPAFAD